MQTDKKTSFTTEMELLVSLVKLSAWCQIFNFFFFLLELMHKHNSIAEVMHSSSHIVIQDSRKTVLNVSLTLHS